MQNKLFISSFICLFSLIQFSCVPKNNSKRIIVASSGKIESLDPARVTSLKSFQLLSSLGDTLYVLNSEGKLVPELALDMPILSDDKSGQYENNLMRRICGLLYMPDKLSGEIKLKIIEEKKL